MLNQKCGYIESQAGVCSCLSSLLSFTIPYRWFLCGIKVFLCPLLLIFSSVSGAQSSVDITSPAHLSGFYFLKLVLSLLLVLGIFIFLARIIRRFNGFDKTSAGPLAVLAGISLGSRERLVIVKAGDEQLLLGISPSGIVKLREFDSPVIIENEPAEENFKAQLNKVFKVQGK